MHLLILDNYDSFTWNLAQLFSRDGTSVSVVRNDMIDVPGIESMSPDAICLSPGPGKPAESGICRDAVRVMKGHVPVLGVCLGMQAINEVFGGTTVRAPVPMHGKTSAIVHSGDGLFQGIPTRFRAARYHSLCLGEVAPKLRVTARSDDGVVMGIRHEVYPILGVQFHPESFLSEHGAMLADNFLRMTRHRNAAPVGREA